MQPRHYEKRIESMSEVVQVSAEGAEKPSFFSSIMNHWYKFRDRILASQRFQSWAVAFPLTRPIARRRARDLFNLCAGFVYSQVLVACIKLDLFNSLYEGPQSLTALSKRLDIEPKRLERLLLAAKSLDLVNSRGKSIYGLGELGAAIVGNDSFVEIIKHHHLLYHDLQDPVALLRGEVQETELGRYWSYANALNPADLKEDQIAKYSALMSVSQNYLIDDILDAFSLDKFQCLLDIGGGEGAFVSAVASRKQDLDLILFDLPPVVARAKKHMETLGLSKRVQLVGGDFFADPLPKGADVISLVRIILDHDDQNSLVLLRSIHEALPQNGVLLVAEPISGISGAETITDAYFGFYLMAMGQGGTRTFQQHEKLLKQAGFSKIRTMRTRRPFLTCLLVAHP